MWTRIAIKLDIRDVLIIVERWRWHLTLITFKLSQADKLFTRQVAEKEEEEVLLDAKNHFLSQTGRFFQQQQRWCRTYSWRQTKLLSKLSEGRPSILLGPFFLKVQCHLFARISLDQMGAVILSTDAILLQNFPNKKQNKTILASLGNTVSIYESMGSGHLPST